MVFLKDFFEKVNSKKKSTDDKKKHAKLRSMQRVKYAFSQAAAHLTTPSGYLIDLKYWDILREIISTILYKGNIFCDFLLTFWHIKLLLTRCLHQKERFSSRRACGVFLSFKVDPSSEGRQNNFKRVASP